MQFSTIIITLFASLALAQDLTGLPDCAAVCFVDNEVNTVCDLTDTVCLCADTAFFGDVETCALAACDTADLLLALAWSEAECPA